MMSLAPDLKKGFLENIVSLRFFMDHAADEGAKGTGIARIEFFQGLLPPLRDLLHEHFVADEGIIGAGAVELR